MIDFKKSYEKMEKLSQRNLLLWAEAFLCDKEELMAQFAKITSSTERDNVFVRNVRPDYILETGDSEIRADFLNRVENERAYYLQQLERLKYDN